MPLKFYTSVAKGVKLKVRKFLGLIPTLVDVTRGKLVGDVFCLLLNEVNGFFSFKFPDIGACLDYLK